MTIRVALVDDQELVRTGLAMVIDACEDMRVVAQAGDGAQALAVLAATHADVVLMDVQMPKLNGVDATAALTARGEVPKVIVLTTFDLDDYAYAALRAGASGFLLKDASAAEVIAAIRSVHSGDAVIAPSTTRRMLDHLSRGAPRPRDDHAVAALTDREREVLVEIARGYANPEIARRLYLSEATVKTHVGHILAKLGLGDRVHVVIFAYDHGLVRPGKDQPAAGPRPAPAPTLSAAPATTLGAMTKLLVRPAAARRSPGRRVNSRKPGARLAAVPASQSAMPTRAIPDRAASETARRTTRAAYTALGWVGLFSPFIYCEPSKRTHDDTRLVCHIICCLRVVCTMATRQVPVPCWSLGSSFWRRIWP